MSDLYLKLTRRERGFVKEIQQLRAELAAETARADALGWQPIETAPRGCVEFQAWCVHPEHPPVIGWWEPKCRYNDDGNFEAWGRVDYDEDGWDSYGITPTHWMPPPNPPKDKP